MEEVSLVHHLLLTAQIWIGAMSNCRSILLNKHIQTVALLTLLTLTLTLTTSEQGAIMPIQMIWLYSFMGIGAKSGFYGGLDGLSDTPYTVMTTRAHAVPKIVVKAA